MRMDVVSGAWISLLGGGGDAKRALSFIVSFAAPVRPFHPRTIPPFTEACEVLRFHSFASACCCYYDERRKELALPSQLKSPDVVLPHRQGVCIVECPQNFVTREDHESVYYLPLP